MEKMATLLTGSFDPGKLPDGLYTAESVDPAYAILWSLAELGAAKFVGERYGERGVKAIVVQIKGGAKGMRRNAQGMIGIGREFFVTALRDYANWQEKWWRECVQNSVDAGATEIRMDVKQDSDGNHVCVCQDNGKGMDEDTLINKFLVLGGSTKKDGNTAGGFGKAKELLVLPWLQWKIETGGISVVGSGIQYEIGKSSVTRGVRLEVIMPQDNHTTGFHARGYVEKCYLPGVDFFINGTKCEGMLRSGKAVKDIGDKATIYHNKSANGHGFYVRVKGLYMFDEYLDHSIPGCIIVELKRSSVELMTANRDGFRDWQTKDEIRRFVSELSKDTQSALKDKRKLIRKKFEGEGNFDVDGKAAQAMLDIPPLPPVKKGGQKLSGSAIGKLANVLKQVGHDVDTMTGVSGELAAAMVETIPMLGSNHMENMIRQLVWRPDFFLTNEVEGYSVPKKFYPQTMTPHVLKLAKVWTEACRYVLIQLNSRANYGVGFVFSDDTLAAYQELDGGDWLLLNPFVQVDENGKATSVDREDRILSTSAVGDLKFIYAAAVHECTHLADGISYHDESFASALTKNMAICADGFKYIKKIAGMIKMGGATDKEDEQDSPKPKGGKRRDNVAVLRIPPAADSMSHTVKDFFEHSVSSTEWAEMAEILGTGPRVYATLVYPRDLSGPPWNVLVFWGEQNGRLAFACVDGQARLDYALSEVIRSGYREMDTPSQSRIVEDLKKVYK